MKEYNAISKDVERIAYWNFLQRTLNGRFPSFVAALRGQTLLQQHLGRTAIVKFEESGNTLVESISRHEELQLCLDDSLNASLEQGQVRRHLYIVEDLGRKNIEILGSQLSISPLFFASHWETPCWRTGTFDSSTLTQNRRQSFKLTFPILHYLKRDGTGKIEPGLYVDLKNNIPRGMQVLGSHNNFETSSHQISFWSMTLDEESWIGVLLVDPSIAEGRLEGSPSWYKHFHDENRNDSAAVAPVLHFEAVRSRTLDSPLLHLASAPQFQQDDPSLPNLEQPELKSTFDDLLYFYETVSSNPSKDPLSALLVSQRYVLYLWQGYLHSRLVAFWIDFRGLHSKPYSEDAIDGYFASWNWAWRRETLHRLTFAKSVLQLMREAIGYDMKILSIDGTRTFLEEIDVEAWKALRDGVTGLTGKLNDLIEVYIQASTLQESQMANEQARNIGRLTTVATILLPITVCTGIFSMSGDFLAGESKFWVFWAWAVPCVLVFTLLAFTHSLHLVKKARMTGIEILGHLWAARGRFRDERNGRRGFGQGTRKMDA